MVNFMNICKLENDRLYINEDGLHIREITLELGLEEEITIGMLSDVHLNYCNAEDFEEADPVLMSTYKNRIWCQNGETVPKLRRCVEYLKDADKIIICGDTLDYISKGTIELMTREVWDKIPDVTAVLGGHEFAIRMQGEVPEKLSYDQRVEMMKNYWKHDIYYKCDIIKDKIMAISLLNDLGKYNEYQRDLLAKDLEKAREMGYKILVFQHEPIATYNKEHENVTEDTVMQVGDPAALPYNFSFNDKLAGSPNSDTVTKEVYSLIADNADVVKGVFAGHTHNHINLTIKGKNGDIPQFVHSATAYDNGHLATITIK